MFQLEFLSRTCRVYPRIHFAEKAGKALKCTIKAYFLVQDAPFISRTLRGPQDADGSDTSDQVEFWVLQTPQEVFDPGFMGVRIRDEALVDVKRPIADERNISLTDVAATGRAQSRHSAALE